MPPVAKVFISYRRKPSAMLATLIAKELESRGARFKLTKEPVRISDRHINAPMTAAIAEAVMPVCAV